ncbi:MAG: hypothetical protein N3I86_15080 [Verrucomicrobiae bacterium]|nr:hypothetical protein [Verrucomicrobiae bacterium]
MELKILSTHPVDGLTVVQFATQPCDTFDYLTSVRALAQNLVTITETTTAGQVNAIRAENHADRPVFFMDGDVLIGAKQTRVLNVSLLLAAKTTTILPVSCVERGRWHSVSARFCASPLAAPPSLRAIKSESLARHRARECFLADQGAVWEKVAELKTAQHAHSPTESLHEIYLEKQARIEQALDALHHTPGANGVAIFHGQRLVSSDVFNRADALADYLPRLVRGALLDTIAEGPTENTTPAPEKNHCNWLSDLLNTVQREATPPQPAPGLGQQRRFTAAKMSGFILEYENQLIHLAMASSPFPSVAVS